jgi:hypothetical protein
MRDIPVVRGGLQDSSDGSDQVEAQPHTREKTLSDYIGGGAYPDAGVEIGVGDDGRATEGISTGTGDMGNSGSPTVDTGDTSSVGTVPTDASQGTLEEIEQTLENKTGGAAFGDPDVVEDVGSGEAVSSPDQSETSIGTGSLLDDPVMLAVAGVIVAGVLLLR